MWVKYNTNSPPEALAAYGPLLTIDIQGLAVDNYTPVTAKVTNVTALIDTGATICGISPKLARQLWGSEEAFGRSPGREFVDRSHTFNIATIGTKTSHCHPHRIFVDNTFNIVAECIIVESLAQHVDFLIGYNVLRDTILNIDSTTGLWSIHFKIPAQR